MPILFWNEMYWGAVGSEMDGSPRYREENPKARLAQLVAQRKAAATQPAPTSGPATAKNEKTPAGSRLSSYPSAP